MKFSSTGFSFWVIFFIWVLFVASSFVACNIEKYYHEIELPKVIGPESIAFDCYGNGPYVSVSDGRILKWQGSHLGWTEFAIPTPNRLRNLCDGSTNPDLEPVCGRPLGIKFDYKTCELYIADAYFGLLKVGPKGGVAQLLANSAEGIPFRFANGLDIDTQTGVVYFTDSSTNLQRRDLKPVLDEDNTGRLMKYDPMTKNVTVLLRGLAMANGVALSKDKSFLLVAESGARRIQRLWLQGPNADISELFAQQERVPDNIEINKRGEFWIALNTDRDPIQSYNQQGENKYLQGHAANPWLTAPKTGGQDSHQVLDAESTFEGQVVNPWQGTDPVAIKFDKDGNIVEVLDGNGGSELSSVSEVKEHNGSLWIGSILKPYVLVLKCKTGALPI